MNWLSLPAIVFAITAVVGTFAQELFEPRQAAAENEAPSNLRIPQSGTIDPYDLWYGIYLDKERVGTLEQKLSLVQTDKERRYVHRIDKQIKIRIEGEKIQVQSIVEMNFSAEKPYRLESARQEYLRGDQHKAVVLRRSGSEFVVTVEGGGTVHSLRNIKIDYTLEDLLSTKSWIKNHPIAGEEITTAELDFENLRVSSVRNSLLRVSQGAVDKLTFDLSVKSSARGDLGVVHLAADGTPDSFDFGDNMRLVREESEQAQQTVYSVNLRDEAQATIDKVLGNPDRIRRLVMEIHGEGARILSQALDDQVEWNEQRGVYVLERVQQKPHFSGSDPDEMELNLAETPTYPIRHRSIRTVATRAVAGSQSQTEAAKRLVAFVNQAISSADLSNSISVLDVLRSRKGTCKDRARLLTALGRSIGLPTREVTGLIYTAEGSKSFAAHSWNEVFIDGKWIAVDPTFNRFNVNPTYISFGTGEQGQTNFARAMGRFKFKLIDVSYGS